MQIVGWCFRFFFALLLFSSSVHSLSVSSLSLSFCLSLLCFSHHSCPHPLSTTPPVHLAENESQQFKSCLHTPTLTMAQKLWKPGTIPVRRKQTCRTQCETCRESERVGRWLDGAEQNIFCSVFFSFLFVSVFFFSCLSVEVPQSPGRRLSRLDRTGCRGSQQGDWSD